MSSQANKEQFLKQFEQIVDGVEQNKGKVTHLSCGKEIFFGCTIIHISIQTVAPDQIG